MVIVRSHIAHVQDLNGNIRDRHALEGSFPSMEAYEAQRSALLQAEKGQRFDAQKLANLTEAERKANDIAQGLKEQEDRKIYNNPLDNGAMKGMDWVGAKARGAHQGALYRLVEQVGPAASSNDLFVNVLNKYSTFPSSDAKGCCSALPSRWHGRC